MESWIHTSKDYSDDIDSPVDGLARTGNLLMGWGTKPPHNFDNNMLVPSRGAVGSMDFSELCVPEMMRNSLPSNPNLGIMGGENGNNSSKRAPSSTCMTTSNSSFGELESGLRLTSSVAESDSQKLSLIDLKLGKLADSSETKSSIFSKERSVLSSVGSSLPAKRTRMTNLCSQTPVCQVHGCNKDLSSSKDYHKRHKVCDVHSKTAKVIVNGIEQRFCQQCSRFHLLAEFDDGKRSCRKRLAGHNERRRKLQLDTHSVKQQKLLQYYQGAGYLGNSLPKRTPFVFRDMLPGGFFSQEGCGQSNGWRHIKLEEEPIFRQSAMPIINGQYLHGMGRLCPSRIFSSETDYTLLDTAAMAKELSGVSNSSCALSLLSAQSQNLSSHSTGIPVAGPLIIQGVHDHQSVDQNSDIPLGVSILEKSAPSGFYSSGMKSIQVDQRGPPMISDAGNSVGFEVHTSGFFQRSNSMNSQYCLSSESLAHC
ncbi:hypothetical protein F0562_033007 [Nyssa sinensis]|uniref:SBP-type domain-containing protein n=1 Tax=Nyssa sinensis TaxID=561372 RepID=A0A5J5ASR2_9ASTE|nr:hypothetical protein F0562_033007 [Nyssa sinensis]